MRTVEDILKPETDIIKGFELNTLMDDYYLELILKGDNNSALAYKYGRVTMGMAIEIRKLKRKLKNI